MRALRILGCLAVLKSFGGQAAAPNYEQDIDRFILKIRTYINKNHLFSNVYHDIHYINKQMDLLTNMLKNISKEEFSFLVQSQNADFINLLKNNSLTKEQQASFCFKIYFFNRFGEKFISKL